MRHAPQNNVGAMRTLAKQAPQRGESCGTARSHPMHRVGKMRSKIVESQESISACYNDKKEFNFS